MTQHKHGPAFIFVYTKNADLFVFGADQAIDVSDRGLLVEPRHLFKAPVNWSEFFNLTFPI